MQKAKPVILLSSHSSGGYGPLEKYYVYFAKLFDVVILRHPLRKNVKKSTITRKIKTVYFQVPQSVQYVLEGMLSIKPMRQIIEPKCPIAIAIGFDPLAVLHLLYLKKIWNIKHIIYFNLDYSKRRFSNRILNTWYLMIDRLSFLLADTVWSLNSTYVDQMVRKHKRKNVFIVPPVHANMSEKCSKKYPHSIIFSGSLSNTVYFELLFIALKQLKKQKKSFLFHIYGNGSKQSEIHEQIKKFGLQKYIKIYNPLPIDELMKKYSAYNVSVAPYVMKGQKHAPDHAFLGSDLTSKIVDSLGVGVPVITTRLNDGFDVIKTYKLGYLVDTSESWELALKQLLFKPKIRTVCSANAKKFAKKYDIDYVLNPRIYDIIKN